MLDGGVLATVQDLGRFGYQHLGVPQSGAMDGIALRIANRLVGNEESAAGIEITLGGTSFEVLAPCVIAVTGADLGARLGDVPLPLWISVRAQPGQRLVFSQRMRGARAYLALAGGVEVPLVLGSRSTYLPGGWGGLDGRALQAGDVLRPAVPPRDLFRLAARRWCTPPSHGHVLRVVLQEDYCNVPRSWLMQQWRVAQASNRIGLRLEGEPLRQPAQSVDSFGVFPGVIQLPPDGLPIVLMADAQPTGGYPALGAVIQADLHHAAQLVPGDSVQLVPVAPEEALNALRTQRAWLQQGVTEDEMLFVLACMRA